MNDKLDEMWAALSAHEPAPSYAEAWATMLRERTEDAAEAAAREATAAARAARRAALAGWERAETAATAAWAAADYAADAAQRAIDAIKREVKP